VIFELCIDISRPPVEVFAFLCNIDQMIAQTPLEKRRLVPVYEKVTPGPVGVGTRYRELVRVLPFAHMEILNEITGFEPDQRLELEWTGGGKGDLAYRLDLMRGGTRLHQRQSLEPRGVLRLFSPFISSAHPWMTSRSLLSIEPACP